MTAGGKGPPNEAGARSAGDSGAGNDEQLGGGFVEPKVDDSDDLVITREEFVTHLLDLGRSAGVIPIYGSDEWEALDPTDPRRIASMVRAAECWRQEGEPEAIRARLEQELTEDDHIARSRIRMAGLEVWSTGFDAAVMGVDSNGRTLTWKRRGASDFKSIAELQRLRRYEPEVPS